MANKMRAIHPGETLKGELEELNLSANACAKALNVPTNRITAILNEHAASLPIPPCASPNFSAVRRISG